MSDVYLTTLDNPYDPVDEFDMWYAFDIRQGYDTLGFLDRVVVTASSLSPQDQEDARTLAIEEIVRENVLGIYTKVYK